MSGPKDFILLPIAVRLAEMASRRAMEIERRIQFLRERAQENQERNRQEAAKIAAKRAELDELKAARRSSLDSQSAFFNQASALRNERHSHERDRLLKKKASENEIRLEQVRVQLEDEAKRASAHQASSSVGLPQQNESTAARHELPENDDLHSVNQTTVPQPSAQQFEQQSESSIDKEIFEVLQWKDLLSADPDVSTFEPSNLEGWILECNLLVDPSSVLSEDGFQRQAIRLVERAKEMQKTAEEKSAKFNTRNELLADVIAALKEIGFSVADPRFDNPQDPGGSVVIVASRGNERMEARIDLSNQIRSTWDEISGEHCKNSFLDYVDAMNSRGVQVKAERDDLQSRPKQIQVNAKDLPRNKTDNV
jgi:hypothetical protein